jgi:hypothetical protein
MALLYQLEYLPTWILLYFFIYFYDFIDEERKVFVVGKGNGLCGVRGCSCKRFVYSGWQCRNYDNWFKLSPPQSRTYILEFNSPLVHHIVSLDRYEFK